MRNGYIICAISYDAAHLVAAGEGLPPASVTTTDWSFYPKTKDPKLLKGATYFLLRIPGNSKGLYRALEEMLDCAAAPVSDPATPRAAPPLPSRSTTLRLV